MIKIPSELSLKEVTRCFQALWDTIAWMDKGPTANLDLHGRRIVNAGVSVFESDYVTRAELKALEKRIAALE